MVVTAEEFVTITRDAQCLKGYSNEERVVWYFYLDSHEPIGEVVTWRDGVAEYYLWLDD